MLPRSAAIAIAVITAIVVTVLLATGVPETLELPVRDLGLRLLPARQARQTVVVAIDENSLRELGRWPWPRTTLAQIVGRVANDGARGVILDVLLSEPASGDADLSRALHRVP